MSDTEDCTCTSALSCLIPSNACSASQKSLRVPMLNYVLRVCNNLPVMILPYPCMASRYCAVLHCQCQSQSGDAVDELPNLPNNKIPQLRCRVQTSRCWTLAHVTLQRGLQREAHDDIYAQPRNGAPHLQAFRLPMQTPSNSGLRFANDGSGGTARSFSCIQAIWGCHNTHSVKAVGVTPLILRDTAMHVPCYACKVAMCRTSQRIMCKSQTVTRMELGMACLACMLRIAPGTYLCAAPCCLVALKFLKLAKQTH